MVTSVLHSPTQHLSTKLHLTSCSVSTHDVDHSLALAGGELSQRVGHGGHTGPPVLLRAVTLHRAQTLASDGIQLPLNRQQLEVGPEGEERNMTADIRLTCERKREYLFQSCNDYYY